MAPNEWEEHLYQSFRLLIQKQAYEITGKLGGGLDDASRVQMRRNAYIHMQSVVARVFKDVIHETAKEGR